MFPRKILSLVAGVLLVFSLLGCDMPAEELPDLQSSATQTQEEESQAQSTVTSISNSDTVMEVHYIDIGQGDATLIKNGDSTMLIDAGDNEHGVALQLYLQKQGIKKLDYLVLTHPDSDHIGGADVIICKFEIGQVFVTDFEKSNNTVEDVSIALDFKSMTAKIPTNGDTYSLGDAFFTFLGPTKNYEDVNNASLCLKLTKGAKTFLFTGDCEEEAELDMLEAGVDVSADVFQAGHHGSRKASSKEFLNAVNPDDTVISCLYGNEYGYPHAKLLVRLMDLESKVFRTDEQGSVVAYCDGNEITFSCAASETWQSGEDRRNSLRETEEEKLDQNAIIVNKNSGTIHSATCDKLPTQVNQVVFESLDEAYQAGYEKCCGNCKPDQK